MDHKLFVELLEKNSRLVIPNLGAFIKRTSEEASVVTFTPFLKKDDRVFRDAIAEHYQLENEDADEIVTGFVDQINEILAESGRYEITNLGIIELDSNGVISFQHLPYKPIVKSTQPTVEDILETKADDEIEKVVSTAEAIMEQTIESAPQQVEESHNIPEEKETSITTATTQTVEPTVEAETVTRPKTTIPYVDPHPSRVVADQSPMSSMVEQPRNKEYPVQPVEPKSFAESDTIQPRPLSSVHSQQGIHTPQRAPGMTPIQPLAGRFPTSTPGGNASQPIHSLGQQATTKTAPPVYEINEGGFRGVVKAIKSDVWLIAAVIAAIVVILLMIYGYITTSAKDELQVNHNIEQSIGEQPAQNDGEPADVEK